MSEYADYLLTAIDTCYGTMKKKQPELAQRIANPCSLFGGTMSEEVECVCDPSSEVSKGGETASNSTPATPATPHTTKKTVPFQTSYVTLTAPLYPITDIRFEMLDFTVFPSRSSLHRMIRNTPSPPTCSCASIGRKLSS